MGARTKNRRTGVSSTPNVVPIPGTKGPTVRVAALAALLILLGVALRGHLPGVQPAEHEQPTGNSAALLGVLAVVTASLLVIAVAIVMSLREPQRPNPSAGYEVHGGGGVRARLSWRLALIGLGVILAYLLVVALLARLRPPQYRGGPSSPNTPGPEHQSGPAAPRPPSRPAGADQHVILYLVASTAALALLIIVATVVARARRRRDYPPATELPDNDVGVVAPASGSESLALAAERGLAEVGDLSREPREAIIACYAAMETALAGAPGAAPQESDTPSEVLARAVEHDAIHAGSATELVALFAEARFSTHVMNEGHREVAERALRLVLDEVRSAV